MNQYVPLEIFEPPSDYSHINWIAAKDFNGLNAGIFLLRVNRWSLNLLTRTATHKHYHPGEDFTFEEQSILARLTEEAKEFKDRCIYVPKLWFNAYFYNSDEAKPGLLLSHFPHPDFKWHMYKWLEALKSDKHVYNRPVAETSYPEEIERFWNVKRRADTRIKEFERNVNGDADPVLLGMQHDETKSLADDFRIQFEELRKGAEQRTDNVEELDKLIDQAEEVNRFFVYFSLGYTNYVTNSQMRS